MKRENCRIIKASMVMFTGILIILLFACSPTGCLSGSAQEERKEMKVFDVYIEILEGEWPVESYLKAAFATMNISFEYPENWGCNIAPDESEEGTTDIYRGSGDYDSMFIHVSISIFADDYPNSFTVPETASLDPNLKLSMDNICGVKVSETKCDIDQATGLLNGYIVAVDRRKCIQVLIESNKGRSMEEYTAVINHFIDTLEIDFNKLPREPSISPY